jgi:3-isopropylmalate/(R)-2-methylmalate dehydratase large subunit
MQITFSGKTLFLSKDADKITAQLAGEVFDFASAGPLRDDISTDEITPVHILSHYDDRLGSFAHTGLTVNGQRPFARDALKNAGVSVLVAGARYGKGSSREHSPMAEKLAGVQLVIAQSFERLYRQNADNIGLLTSTDMSLAARIAGGETIDMEEILAGRDALTATILRSGGLLAFGQSLQAITPHKMAQSVPLDTTKIIAACADIHWASGLKGLHLFEKIIYRHLLNPGALEARPQVGDGVFIRADWRFIHEYYTGMAAHMLHTAFGAPLALRDTASIIAFEDHTNYVEQSPAHLQAGLVPNMHAMCAAHRAFVADNHLTSYRALTEAEAALEDRQIQQADGRSGAKNVAGISHAIMNEHYALPGQVVVGTDSHTPHSSALGCVAFGVGTTDMANAFMTGAVRLRMPECLKIDLQGALPVGITAKDIALHLLALPAIKAGLGVGKVFEFTGSAIAQLKTDERSTLTNMTAELGGLTGIVAPDAETLRFLKERRGVDCVIEDWMHSDLDAVYAQTITVDCSQLSPMLAAPGDPGNGLALSALQEPVKVHIAYGGSCTAGKREDFDHYHAVLHWAAQRGLRVPDGVTLYLQFGTTAVRDYCQAQGYMDAFNQVGAKILQPSCGACANCGPGSSTDTNQVTISAINRNFPGRSGPGQVWLASPPTVVASAIAGQICSFAQLQQRFV